MRHILYLLATFSILVGCELKPAGKSPVGPIAPITEGTPVVKQAAAKEAKVELQTRDFDGLTTLIKSHQGKVVVMDAWSTSCPPCLKEFPNLVEIHKKHGPEKVACISLSLDYTGLDKLEDSREPVLGFLQEKGATFDNVLASEADEVMTKKLMIGAVPAVFVYDKQGDLAKTFQGAFTYEQVKELVESLVK